MKTKYIAVDTYVIEPVKYYLPNGDVEYTEVAVGKTTDGRWFADSEDIVLDPTFIEDADSDGFLYKTKAKALKEFISICELLAVVDMENDGGYD